MTQTELDKVIILHRKWYEGDNDGVRANLIGRILAGLNLKNAMLRGANLANVNLTQSNLDGANLIDSNLSYSNLTDATFKWAYLISTCLKGVKNANFTEAYGIDQPPEPLKLEDFPPTELESLQSLNEILETKIMEQGQEIEALKAKILELTPKKTPPSTSEFNIHFTHPEFIPFVK